MAGVTRNWARAIPRVLLAFGVAAAPGRAGEMCVACKGPEHAYRCVFGDNIANTGTDPRAQLLCITELAKFGHHESCSVLRNAPAECPGDLRAVHPPVEAGLPPLKPPPAGPGGAPAPLPGPRSDSEAPRTMEELAKKAVKSTGADLSNAGTTVADTAKSAGKSIESAGNAVGKAAKSTWHCIASFFTDC